MTTDKLRHYALCVFLFLCPIIYNNTNLMDLRDFQERSFQLLVICLFAFFVGNLWIGAFIILNVFLLIYNDWTVGLPQVLNIFLGSVLFLLSRSYFKKKEITPYLKILLWVAVLNIFWMIMQGSGIDPLYIGQNASGEVMAKRTFQDFSGLFGIKMAGGIFLAIVTPILASINLFILPFMAIPIYFCRASVVGLAIFVSMSFYFYHLHRYTENRVSKFLDGLIDYIREMNGVGRFFASTTLYLSVFVRFFIVRPFISFIIIGSIFGSIYAYYDFKDDSQTFKSRFPLWHMGLKYTLAHPLGYGPDSWRSYNKKKDFLFYSDREYNPAILKKIGENKALFKYYDMDNGKMAQKNNGVIENGVLNWWDNAHNEYVQLMFEYGFISLLLLGGLIREMYYRFKFAIKSKELVVITSCLLVYFVSGLGHFPIHLARLAFLFPILLGAFYSRTDEVLT